MANYEQYFSVMTDSMRKLSPRETIQDAGVDLDQENEEEEVHADSVEIDWENLDSCRAAIAEESDSIFSRKVDVKSSPAMQESKNDKAHERMLFVQNLPSSITAKKLYQFLKTHFPSEEYGKILIDFVHHSIQSEFE